MFRSAIFIVSCVFLVVSFGFAEDLKKVDSPSIEMLQGTWEGTFKRNVTGRYTTASGPFDMKIKGKRAFVTRGAVGNDTITQWTVTIDKIDKSKIFMSNAYSEFELELFTNPNAEFFIAGDYTGRKAGGSRSVNSDIKLKRTNSTVDESKMPAEGSK